jgi:PAS domain S-box-containing protein
MSHGSTFENDLFDRPLSGRWQWDLSQETLLLDSDCLKLAGLGQDEATLSLERLRSMVHHDGQSAFFNALRVRRRHGSEVRKVIFRCKTTNGVPLWLESSSKAVGFDSKGRVTRLVGRVVDVTDRKMVENEFSRLHRVHLANSKCNQALLQALNETELLNDICRTIVDIGGYRMTWVGYAEHDKQKSVRPVAWAGFEEGYLATLNISLMDCERGHGPTGTAIRTGKPCVAKDTQTDPKVIPWRSEALRRGYASSMSLPLKSGEVAFGALMIYSILPDAFNADEIELLTSLAENLAYGITMLRNRTEKAAAEKALRQSESKYKSLFNNRYTVMLIVDPSDGSIIEANPAAAEYYGWSAAELCSMNIKQINILSQQEVQEQMRLAKAKNCNHFQFRHRLADGTVRDVEVTSGPITIDGRALLYSIINDVSDRLQFQKMLIESNARTHYIMSATNTGLWEMGIDNGISEWSDELWDMYGLEAHSFEPSFDNWLQTVIPEDREALRSDADKALATRTEFNGMWRIRKPDGSLRWLMSKGLPVFGANGDIEKYIGICIDVTERKQAEESKRQLESQLRRSQKLETIGTLAGGIAHDLNNILTPVMGYSEMGLLVTQPTEPPHSYFGEIVRASERAKSLIAQILTFSRSQDITPSVVSVQAIIDESLKLLRPSIPSMIRIETDIDRSCRNILANPAQILQVIVNIATNAFQAIGDFAGELRIELKEIVADQKLLESVPKLRAGKYVCLRISDTGSGMDEATMERIFEPFFTTKSDQNGTGLGLSVVHGIIASYSGEITVDSQLGKGTTFTIYLPVINTPCSVATPEPGVLRPGNGSILFVDDEEASTRMMQEMLDMLGYRVDTSNSPEEALEMFSRNPGKYDLVISDLTMPKMNGMSLAKKIRNISPVFPIMLITGYDKSVGTLDNLGKAGISRLLRKPVRMSELASAIKDVLGAVKW